MSADKVVAIVALQSDVAEAALAPEGFQGSTTFQQLDVNLAEAVFSAGDGGGSGGASVRSADSHLRLSFLRAP